MTVWTDASEKETNPSEIADFSFVQHTEKINIIDNLTLERFRFCPRLPDTERKVHNPLREDLIHSPPLGQSKSRRVDQHRLLRGKTESFDIELMHIIIETVMLLSIHWIKLIDLHEEEAFHIGTF